MTQKAITGTAYVCLMHSNVRQLEPGKCPKCGMALICEGARFGLLRHLIGPPVSSCRRVGRYGRCGDRAMSTGRSARRPLENGIED